MKLEGVDFPETLIKALRDECLVVFAGAGVSMGEPAKLPSFNKLAELVAEGTGESQAQSETMDQFLGRLEDRHVHVHERAAQALQCHSPNELHGNLCRLFGKPEGVRIVTTNFDCLFEEAFKQLHHTSPKLFQAPALPLGRRFKGIVHLHGSLKESKEMILTHRDFGRAYLTEAEGWARRFLVELFTHYTVLFVGYSHSDTIMNYLTPSLPPDSTQKRLALIREGDDSHYWERMGVEPIVFPQNKKNDFASLDISIKKLADFVCQGAFDWQQEVTIIAAREPPIDEERAGIIDHALTSVNLTSCFVKAAKSPDWIYWLYNRKHLGPLFNEEALQEQDIFLSRWLATQFFAEHSDKLFRLIDDYGGKLNTDLWNNLVYQLHQTKQTSLNSQTLLRWSHYLTSYIPPHAKYRMMYEQARNCTAIKAFQNLLRIYDVMTAIYYPARLAYVNGRFPDGFFCMKDLWKDCLEPNLADVAYPLLERTTMRLEEHHEISLELGRRDHSQYRNILLTLRSTIEPQPQSQNEHIRIIPENPRETDPLIDVARDCLEWLARNDDGLAYVKVWCDRFARSEVPILRRLAIHAMKKRTDLSADGKISWLLENCDVHGLWERPEIFRIAACAYPQASCQQKNALIQAIEQNQAPKIEDHNDELSVYKIYKTRFYWFEWLSRCDPSCAIVETKLRDIKSQYPDFPYCKRPDLYMVPIEVEEIVVESHWSTEDLLAKPAAKWLPELLNPPSTRQERWKEEKYERSLKVVTEAAQKNVAWGLDLADEMVNASEWNTELWGHLISAWETSEIDQNSTARVLRHLSESKLHGKHTREIANVLIEIIQNAKDVEINQLLQMAHSIATALQPQAVAEGSHQSQLRQSQPYQPDSLEWLHYETDRNPSGRLTLFWLFSIERWYKQKKSISQSLNAKFDAKYQQILNTIIQDDSYTGNLGRALLAAHLHCLYTAYPSWTEEHLLPLFDSNHKDFQCIWNGYLNAGQMTLQSAELLQDKQIAAIQRILERKEFDENMLKKFVRFYVFTMSTRIEHANDRWIIEFFKHANDKARACFAASISDLLDNLDQRKQQEWWNVWLKDYWENRLQGVPRKLDPAEINTMLNWVIYLHDVFPEAVDMAVRMDLVQSMDPVESMDPVQSKYQQVCTRYQQVCMIPKIDDPELIDLYPNKLAEFLLHLGKSSMEFFFYIEDLSIFDKLLEKSLPENLEKELQELKIKINAIKSLHGR